MTGPFILGCMTGACALWMALYVAAEIADERERRRVRAERLAAARRCRPRVIRDTDHPTRKRTTRRHQ